ncbi:MAG TPA: glycosyl hydrolase 53 family protein, partial [Bacteroidia bacterium]|nr:glycosyl hydrolase 53 family protein [Bacteroidia bacterium]
MKKILFNLATLMFLTHYSNAQTFNGKLGYAISPEGFPAIFDSLPTFLTEVSNTCNNGVLLINGAWRDGLSTSGNIPTLQKTLLPLHPVPYNFVDLSVYGWATYPTLYLDNPTNPTNNWANPLTRDAFLQMLIRTADSLSPTYMMIGNEVNFYWEQDSVDYSNWASFYSMAYDSIKAHSPTTKVGTVYNYEHLSGQGVLNGWNTPYWSALSSMDTSKMDVISITLYPYFNYTTANAIPLTYLDGLFNRIGNIPVVFSETGWPADNFGFPWTSSTTQQVDYINKLFPMLTGRNVEAVNWLFLNYYMANNNFAFKSVSMRDSLGNDYPALPFWLSHCSTTSVNESINESEQVQIFPNPVVNKFTLQIK